MLDFVNCFDAFALAAQGPKLVTHPLPKGTAIKEAGLAVILNEHYLRPIHCCYAYYVSNTQECRIAPVLVNITGEEAVEMHY
jgi:hypothetical protein